MTTHSPSNHISNSHRHDPPQPIISLQSIDAFEITIFHSLAPFHGPSFSLFPMGAAIQSSILLINDSNNDWRCTVTKDVLSLKITYLILAGIAAFAGMTGTLATATPYFLGIREAELTANTAFQYTVASVKTFAKTVEIRAFMTSATLSLPSLYLMITKSIEEQLSHENLVMIQRNQSHAFPSRIFAWRQATCFQYYEVNVYKVRTETLYMRPLFVGALSRPHYKISDFLRKNQAQIKEYDVLIQ